MGVYLGKLKVGIETPAVEKTAKRAGYELRTYGPAVSAEVESQGSQMGGGDAFGLLARYIGVFGKPANVSVTAKQAEKIAMTAPVTSQQTSATAYKMAFILPNKYQSVDQAPEPEDPRVKLVGLPRRVVAAKGFGGYAREEDVEKQKAALLKLLQDDAVATAGEPELARYNDPWTPGFLRTNEIWVVVDEASANAAASAPP